MILPLSYYGDAVLRKKAAEVEVITDEVRNLVRDMTDTVRAQNGIGLAAPQVHYSLRIFITALPEEDEGGESSGEGEIEVFINPILSSPSEEEVEFAEGCLSIPGLCENVVRPESIVVEAMNLDGKLFKRRVRGLEARVIMHENDHLNGVLFIDRIKGKKRKSLDVELRRLKKEYAKREEPK